MSKNVSRKVKKSIVKKSASKRLKNAAKKVRNMVVPVATPDYTNTSMFFFGLDTKPKKYSEKHRKKHKNKMNQINRFYDDLIKERSNNQNRLVTARREEYNNAIHNALNKKDYKNVKKLINKLYKVDKDYGKLKYPYRLPKYSNYSPVRRTLKRSKPLPSSPIPKSSSGSSQYKTPLTSNKKKVKIVKKIKAISV
jgi:hypothetical protein